MGLLARIFAVIVFPTIAAIAGTYLFLPIIDKWSGGVPAMKAILIGLFFVAIWTVLASVVVEAMEWYWEYQRESIL